MLQLHLAIKLDLALGRVGREACGGAAAVSTEAQGGTRDAKRRHTERLKEAERTRDTGQVLDVEGRRRGRRLGHLRRGGERRHHSHGRPICLMTQVTGAGVTGGCCMRTSARGARVVVGSRARTIWRGLRAEFGERRGGRQRREGSRSKGRGYLEETAQEKRISRFSAGLLRKSHTPLLKNPCVMAVCRPPIPPLGCLFSFFFLRKSQKKSAPAAGYLGLRPRPP